MVKVAVLPIGPEPPAATLHRVHGAVFVQHWQNTQREVTARFALEESDRLDAHADRLYEWLNTHRTDVCDGCVQDISQFIGVLPSAALILDSIGEHELTRIDQPPAPPADPVAGPAH